MKFSIETRCFTETDIHPTQLAVVGQDTNLTWGELEQRSNFYKNNLLEMGLRQGELVGVYGHKQADYLAAVCACISLGCPYIPMDHIYPEDRVSKILKISNAFCIINLDKKTIEKNNDYIEKNLLSLQNVIYIIFTSGSTGDPKGVQISKDSVLNMLNWMKEDFNLVMPTVFMNQAPFSFDLSVYELMFTLHFGQTVIFNSREQIKNSSEFLSRLNNYKMNTWVSTPSFAWSQCILESFNSEFLPHLNCFLFCGEVLPVKLVKKLKQLFPASRILNTYGPTEATVATTLVEITNEVIQKYDTLPVGYPKKDSLVYVDGTNEICIVGENVMLGYLNRQDLNETKMFIHENRRGFKTGDIGFFKDGLLFCQGRMDDQIKLHGYRIELSEIEHILSSLAEVKEVSVVPIRRAEEVVRLIAFLKLESTLDLSFDVFKGQIEKKLPNYMIPSEFILIEHFPVSANHKIDRKKLLEIYQNDHLKRWKS